MVEASLEYLGEARLHLCEYRFVECLGQHVDGGAEVASEGQVVCGLWWGIGQFAVREVPVPVGFLDSSDGGGCNWAFLCEVPGKGLELGGGCVRRYAVEPYGAFGGLSSHFGDQGEVV